MYLHDERDHKSCMQKKGRQGMHAGGTCMYIMISRHAFDDQSLLTLSSTKTNTFWFDLMIRVEEKMGRIMCCMCPIQQQ